MLWVEVKDIFKWDVVNNSGRLGDSFSWDGGEVLGDSLVGDGDGDEFGEAGLGDLGLDVLTTFKGLLPSDDLSNALDEDVDQVDLGLAKSVGVGNVPGAAS